MTETERRNAVVTQARAWLGFRESDGSFKKIIDVYNSIKPLPGGYRMKYTDPWCAAFVSAVGQEVGLSSIILPECSCQRMIDLYRAHGRWEENDNFLPSIGDLVMYDWGDSGMGDNKGVADHVGIVVSIHNSVITVIEGNKSDMVAYRTISRNGKYIRGYCRPNYASKATPEPKPDPKQDEKPSPEPVKPAPIKTKQYHAYQYSVKINLLKLGDFGPQVSQMQALLYCKGFGGVPTGKFDEATKKALISFQKKAGLSADGEFGGASFNALWNWG